MVSTVQLQLDSTGSNYRKKTLLLKSAGAPWPPHTIQHSRTILSVRYGSCMRGLWYSSIVDMWAHKHVRYTYTQTALSLSHMNKKKTIKKIARKTSNNARDARWSYALRLGMKIMCVNIYERSSALCEDVFFNVSFVRMLCMRTHTKDLCSRNFLYICRYSMLQALQYANTNIYVLKPG